MMKERPFLVISLLALLLMYGFLYFIKVTKPVNPTARGNGEVVAQQASLIKAHPTPSTHCSYYRKGKKNLYWGDLHVHTANSLDAYGVGTRNGPLQAYAFAQGQALTLADNKTQIKIDRPLDFTAVTDHAELFGARHICFHTKHKKKAYCRGLKNLGRRRTTSAIGLFLYAGANVLSEKPKLPFLCGQKGVNCLAAAQSVWRDVQKAAHSAYRHCSFTTFAAYEWTPTPKGLHFHRNVIYANEKVPDMAFDYVRYPKREDLWKALQRHCIEAKGEAKGCDVLAIPHNPNFSNGRAFQVEDDSQASLALRSQFEKLVEIHQTKGNSECLNPYGDDRKDCSFEIAYNFTALGDRSWLKLGSKMPKQRWDQLRSSYVRSSLIRGLKMYTASGSKRQNPLKLGFVASTDTHNATPGNVKEKGFVGQHSMLDQTTKQRRKRLPDSNPGGLVAVWAEENTRAAIFAALKRRETYATSGPRIRVKLHQTWAKGDLCQAGALDGEGHIPMGGTMPARRSGQGTARFVVKAMMDKHRLQRIDLIRLSYTKGAPKRDVFSLSADDTKQGDTTMCRVWADSAFDPKAPTLWYARVVEMPSKRWSKYDCEKANNCKQFPHMDKMIQERAWTSPIWYLP